MRRLYFRIYLAVLGSLALFAVLVGLSGWVFHELREPDLAGQQPPFMQDVAEHLLPPSASAAALGRELLFWHKRTKFDLALLSPAGEVIALAASSRTAHLRSLPVLPKARAFTGTRMAHSQSNLTTRGC